MLSYFIPFNSINSHMTLSEKQKCMMLFYALGLLGKQNLESKQHFLPLQGRCSRYPWEDLASFLFKEKKTKLVQFLNSYLPEKSIAIKRKLGGRVYNFSVEIYMRIQRCQLANRLELLFLQKSGRK